MSTAEPAQLSIWGGLLVEASGAAARANRPTDADDLLAAVAAAAAARLGEDRWDRWCERAGSRRSALLDRMVEHLKLVPAA